MDENNDREFEMTGPAGTKLRIRGYDFLSVLMIVGLTVMVYTQWSHAQSAERAQEAAVTYAQETARAIREMTCVLSLDQDKRFDQIGRPDSYCKRISK